MERGWGDRQVGEVTAWPREGVGSHVLRFDFGLSESPQKFLCQRFVPQCGAIGGMGPSTWARAWLWLHIRSSSWFWLPVGTSPWF